MFTKKLMIVSLLLGLFATGLIAKEASYTEAAKPELTLEKKDLSIITKAISKKFSGLSKAEKKSLIEYLEDYAKSAKHPIDPVKPGPPGELKGAKKLGTKK